MGSANRGSEIFEAWKCFVSGGVPPGPAVDEEISESWLRCRSYGVDPHGGVGPVVSTAQLGEKVAANRKFIEAARPFMKDLCQVAGPGFVAVLTDAGCLLLEMTGDPSVSRRAGQLNFAPGAIWSEATVGTNAIGTAVAT
ncbi:MAG: AAA family ATPase, partial [Bacillota bacterium]